MSTAAVGAGAAPSLSKQPKYYEADGALRAYANRTLWVAIISGVIALIAVAIMIFIRLQPPTVIRVLPNGDASVVSSDGSVKTATSPSALNAIAASEAPTAFEKENYVRTFVDRYLNYDAHTMAQNWSSAINMMTANLRALTLNDLQKSDTVGRYQQEHIRSVFKLSQIQAADADPMFYSVTGTRTVTRVTDAKNAVVQDIVESYNVRLTEFQRSGTNPAGLLVAEVKQNQIHAETKEIRSAGLPGDGQEQ